MATQTKNKPGPPRANGDAKKPFHSIYYPVMGGTLKVSFFDKVIETQNGNMTVYAVSVQRSYAKGENDRAWTSSLRDMDIPVAVQALHAAYAYIATLRQENRDQRQEARGDAHEEPIPF